MRMPKQFRASRQLKQAHSNSLVPQVWIFSTPDNNDSRALWQPRRSPLWPAVYEPFEHRGGGNRQLQAAYLTASLTL